MMGKKKHLNRDELALLGHRQRQALDAAAMAIKIITLVILHDRYKFGPKRLQRFVEQFEDVLAYYNASNDYQNLLQEWNDYFDDYAGIRILPEKGKKK